MFPQNKNGVLIGPVLSLCFVWVKVHVNNIHDIDMLCGAQASGVGSPRLFSPLQPRASSVGVVNILWASDFAH